MPRHESHRTHLNTTIHSCFRSGEKGGRPDSNLAQSEVTAAAATRRRAPFVADRFASRGNRVTRARDAMAADAAAPRFVSPSRQGKEAQVGALLHGEPEQQQRRFAVSSRPRSPASLSGARCCIFVPCILLPFGNRAAVRMGFEPTVSCPTAGSQSAALDHSATHGGLPKHSPRMANSKSHIPVCK